MFVIQNIPATTPSLSPFLSFCHSLSGAFSLFSLHHIVCLSLCSIFIPTQPIWVGIILLCNNLEFSSNNFIQIIRKLLITRINLTCPFTSCSSLSCAKAGPYFSLSFAQSVIKVCYGHCDKYKILWRI